jgi:transglutaminase-like putative cysteine protease
MNRRTAAVSILAALPATPVCLASTGSSMTEKFLSATAYIDSEHPRIRAAVNQSTSGLTSPVDRAVRIHDFVRDSVRFGWSTGFYDQSASEVLRHGVGYCNTKSTLFVAMLRAAGIPARQRFVNIHASILDPFTDPGTPYVDHSYTEVLLDRNWLSVDSYIVDKPLFAKAKRRLERETKVVGYGVHLDGTCEWNGKTDSFAQFVRTGRFPELTRSDFGVFEDVGAFYASGNGVNKFNGLVRLAFGLVARSANQRIEALRSEA